MLYQCLCRMLHKKINPATKRQGMILELVFVIPAAVKKLVFSPWELKKINALNVFKRLYPFLFESKRLNTD